ncbi:MAG: M67 family metallopeptidase [Candidatus Omnitrophota bacterium]|nr:M67 family metallopeptidase [Candidatus Omnitrophota bacterium]
MLILKKYLADEIIDHCKREFPNEACGILAGKEGKAEKVYEMKNADASPSTFLMEPKEQLCIMKDMRNSGVQMTGIYHSHVASQAYPSEHDVKMAFYPEVSYVIISLKDDKNPVIRSFKIQDGKIKEEDVRVG